MSGQTADKLARLCGMLREEKVMLAEISEITNGQTVLLESDRVEELNKSLDRRQVLIDKIEGLHQEANALMQSYVSKPPEDREGYAEAEQLQADIRVMIAEIAEKNKTNMAAAKEVSEQYSMQGNKLTMGRKSIGLYAQGAVYSGDNFDSRT